jgi:transcriptional regulator with GAF, ATPase, and Fis domain
MAVRVIKVLVLEDSPEDAELLMFELRRGGFAPEWTRAATEAEFQAGLDAGPDVVLADYTLPQFDAPAALVALKQRDLDVPFIVVTGSVGEERAVACMREGAADCLLKDRLQRLGPAVERALADRQGRQAKRAAEVELERLTRRLEQENRYLREEIAIPFQELVGGSDAIRASLAQIEAVAATEATVLVLGETGTGKELAARAIHQRSKRRDRPLVKVNCAALSPSLVETELFGHEKGAFTGAVARAAGRFELAHGGTLFLDEVGELPAAVQAKLLRVLQEGELERVGSGRTIKVDVRLIAATNRDLHEEVLAGRFRSDLYYRLNVFPIELPPLRERAGDVASLAHVVAARAARKHGKAPAALDAETLLALEAYSWPGNVRELENVIERAVITAGAAGGSGSVRVAGMLGARAPEAAAPTFAALHTVEQVEVAHIRRVLDRTEWQVEGEAGAARILGLNPSTLRSRMKKLGISRG